MVFTHNNKYFVQARRSKFLNGLYGFVEYDAGTYTATWGKGNYPILKKNYIGTVSQSYSHFTLQAEVYKIPVKPAIGVRWKTLAELAKLPLSRADSKIVQLLS